MVESAGPLEKWRHYFHSSYITVIILHNSNTTIVKTVFMCPVYVVTSCVLCML